MHTARVLVGLLLLATLLVDLSVVVWSRSLGPERSGNDVHVGIVASLVLTQVSLLAILVSLGRPTSPWPWVGLFGGVLLGAVFFSCHLHDGQLGPLLACLVFFSLQAALVAVVLIAFPWAARRLRRFERGPTGEGSQRRFQFSIARVFAWTTGVAICLGSAQLALAGTFDLSDTLDWLAVGVAISLASALLGVCAAWFALGQGHVWLRAFLFVATVPLGMEVNHLAGANGGSPGRLFLLSVFAAQAVLLLASLGVVRMAGYRLGHPEAAPAHQPPSPGG